MNSNNHTYVASCIFTRHYPLLSASIQEYVSKRFNMPVMRCCVKNYKTKELENAMPEWYRPDWCKVPPYRDISSNETMVSICHNCSAIFLEQMPDVKILSLWELVLQDEEFPFPDYGYERMTVQDCWRSKENHAEQEAVRSLLKKMNIEIVELKDNRGKTDFCGASLYEAAPVRNLKMAPKRFVENAAGKFIPHTDEEKTNLMNTYCSRIATDKVVGYCHYCVKGLNMGGKQGVHLAELLFPSC